MLSMKDPTLKGGLLYSRFVSLFEVRKKGESDVEKVTEKLLAELVEFG